MKRIGKEHRKAWEMILGSVRRAYSEWLAEVGVKRLALRSMLAAEFEVLQAEDVDNDIIGYWRGVFLLPDFRYLVVKAEKTMGTEWGAPWGEGVYGTNVALDARREVALADQDVAWRG